MQRAKDLRKTIRFIEHRWLPALRSGKYTQGQGSLAVLKGRMRKMRFCCLGVACDLVDPKGWVCALDDFSQGGNYGWNESRYDQIRELSGATKWPMPALPDEVARTLAELNDESRNGLRNGFKTIATYIEKKVLPQLKKELKECLTSTK